MSKLIVDISKYDLNKVALDKNTIKSIMPQRFEFEQLDAITYYDANEGIIIGKRALLHNEFWVKGHIPGNPIFPGVMILEALAQIACLLYKLVVSEVKDKFVVFAGIDNVKFRGFAKPGDNLILTARKILLSPRACKAHTQAIINSNVITEADVFGVPT